MHARQAMTRAAVSEPSHIFDPHMSRVCWYGGVGQFYV
jgi:hypothetical protein